MLFNENALQSNQKKKKKKLQMKSNVSVFGPRHWRQCCDKLKNIFLL